MSYGRAPARIEDHKFLTGAGQYVDDIRLPRQCHAAVVLSPHAHADILSIDPEAARKMPGVIAVLTGADVVSDGLGSVPPYILPIHWGGPPAFTTLRPILISDRVRCVGDRVAVVVAETVDQARAAADSVVVEYRVLDAVTDAEAALAQDAPIVWPENEAGNRSVTLHLGDAEKTRDAFAAASHVVRRSLESPRLAPAPLEPRACLGMFNASSGQFTLYTSSQDPHGCRKTLAGVVFKVPESSIRVISPDVGGGFGLKSHMFPEDAIVLWASRRVGRPVKWVGTRSESFLTDTQGRGQKVHAEMALDAAGRILGIRVQAYHNLGGYFWATATPPLFFSLRLIPNIYKVPAVDLTTHAVFTNLPPMAVYRGAGRPEATYVIERLMDAAAAEIGMDPADIRRINAISEQDMPYTNVVGFTYDSGAFREMIDQCLDAADWNGYPERAKQSAARGLLRGRSITSYVEIAGVMNERMELRFDPSGTLTILAGTHSHGQGHQTVFTQLVSGWLGIPQENIRYIQGDTDAVLIGRGTFAARSTQLGGTALLAAKDEIVARARGMAAIMLETPAEEIDFDHGLFRVRGTNRAVPLQEVAKMFYLPAGPVVKLGLGLSGQGTSSGLPGGAPNFPNGCQVCEVEVDPETGMVKVDRIVAIDDVGKILNAALCEGQIHGGMAQGLGQALMEEMTYGEDGQLLSGSFMDYGLPRAEHMPDITSHLLEIPAKTNPLGIKGIGESGAIGTPVSVVNAVLDAVRSRGVDDIGMPVSPPKLWAALNAAASGQ
ncbi:MAG: xanthine dehydrogenase family protein molybdopterin-binding subunit [Mesorhizobium sp.]|nr:xanthine dehydrogenase family protein molybdopterin-binding subunit [Mesorhizobium sp.]MCO5162709.1 xanthine dehydrogenase family protein molybdopterin-binding subunit [Mesorhizobium sp.]